MIETPQMTDEPAEYDCIDCGRHVLAWGYNTQLERCNSCLWITRNVPLLERDRVREFLGVPLRDRTAC
jgi:hypothetical protein